MEYPFVSVIVPAYNAEKTIAACIESLIAQEYPKERYEIIIVDNKSTDNTAAIIKQYPVIYLLEDQIQTAYAARNRGIRQAKGNIIALTDSDCVADRHWIEEGVRHFNDDSVGVVGGLISGQKPENWIELYQERRKAHNAEKSMSSENIKAKIATVPAGNLFIRISVLAKIGLFNQNLKGGGDSELCYRIQNESEFALVFAPNALVYHRQCTSIRELIEQQSRYGFTRMMILHAYYEPNIQKLQKYGFIKPMYWRIHHTILGYVSSTFKYGLAYSMSFKSDFKLKFIDNFLDTISRSSAFFGELKYIRRYNLPCCYLWIFMDDSLKRKEHPITTKPK